MKKKAHIYPILPDPKDKRLLEAKELAEMARRLCRAQAEKSLQDLREAALDNLKLWQRISLAVNKDDTFFPADLRNNLQSLSNFVTNTSTALIRNPDYDQAAVLVNINRSLAIGQHKSAAPFPSPYVRPPRLLYFSA